VLRHKLTTLSVRLNDDDDDDDGDGDDDVNQFIEP